MIIYLASSNQHKIFEIEVLLKNSGLEVGVRGADDVGGMPDVAETSDSFEGNARLKARALQEMAPPSSWVLADDSGLIVDALDGEPGVRSARFAGFKATDAKNNDKLLRLMKDIPYRERTARYVCSLVLVGPGGNGGTFSGTCEGRIHDRMTGFTGFGYDPLFIPNGYQKTFAELGPDLKTKISHRATALAQMAEWFQQEYSNLTGNPTNC